MQPATKIVRSLLIFALIITISANTASYSIAQPPPDQAVSSKETENQQNNFIFLPLTQGNAHGSAKLESEIDPPFFSAPSQPTESQVSGDQFEQSRLWQELQASIEALDKRQVYASALPNGVNFGQSGLAGANLSNPTSLDFGPDGRLYVSQQDGLIYAYTITRQGFSDYVVSDTETINVIQQNTPNYNDDGARNFTQARQVTGIMSAGTANNPVLYVTSSDWRISVGSDSGLDTNSGVLTRLTWTGGSWDRVDLVRGLPRSEENHSTNGMDLDEATNTLYVMSGGNSNKGAPGNLLSGTPEYQLAAALLSVDLNALDALPIYTDARTGAQFVYDLPTLDDPTRGNITNSSSDFPYPSNHPLYNSTIDPGDPFGGNNGLNQAIAEPGGPVQIYSPGYRNAYDVVLTQDGKLYTSDNGPNTGWGGLPLIYASNGSPKGTGPYNPGAGDYCTDEFNETDSAGHGDPLHFISGQGYYGGHPAPIRAFPEEAGIRNYINNGGGWQQSGPTYNFADLLPAGIGMGAFPDSPVQCVYSSDSNVIDVINASTNGLTEYTASNFGGALQGSILTASFDGNIYYYKMNGAGNAYTQKEVIFSGFGSIPLDVMAQGDGELFAGTVWAATYGSNNITVFEPQQTSGCGAAYDINLDEDGDGYSNADEIDAGTDPCSGGSTPTDFDGDFLSDVSDPDDDEDGVADVVDAFALDANNGLSTNIPLNYSFFNNDPGTGLFGLGFTGLMTNGTDDWLDLYDENVLAAGGTAGLMTVEAVNEGDAYMAGNNQANGFLFGVNADATTAPFSIQTRLLPPYFGVNGNPGTPTNYQSMGLFIGPGDQDNYLKFVYTANGGNGGVEVLLETGGTIEGGAIYGPAVTGNMLSATTVDLILVVNPQTSLVQPQIALNSGTVVDIGNPVPIPVSWLSPSDGKGLAVGIISTSNQSGLAFGATWDFFNIEYETTTGNNPPAISSPGNQNNQEGDAVTLAIVASDPDGDPISFSASGLPAGLSIDTTTGQIGGTLPAGSAGTYNTTITVSDGALSASAAFAWTVTGPGGGSAIRINAGGNAVTAGGESWLADTYFSTGSNTYITPDSISGTTADAIYQSERYGNFSYAIPAPNDCYAVTLHFAEIYWQQAGSRLFSVELEGETVLSGYDIFAQVGHDAAETESFTANVTDGQLDIVFTTAVDNAKLSAIEAVSATGCGGGGNNPPTISSPGNQSGLEGDNISLTVAASDPDGDALGFSAAGLPTGLIMVEGTGEIAGTLAAGSAGTYNVTATVSDGALTDSVSFVWTVIEPTGGNNPPTVTSPGNQSDQEGDAVSLPISASDPDGDTLSFSATGLPSGVNINPATGVIAGTVGANSAGSYNATVTVSDGALTDSAAFVWTISGSTGGGDIVRINAGGPAVTTQGVTWGADNYFSGGFDFYSTTDPIANTQADVLYQTERFGSVSYTIPVDNGCYAVNLHFAEIYWLGAGQRLFDVAIEGEIVLNDYALFTVAGGHDVATVETELINITDGAVNISLVTLVDNAKISAIEVVSTTGCP